MNPIDYVESIKERLATDSIITSFDIIREFSNLNEAFIRVRATLTNGDILDLSEFIQQETGLEIVSYRYQWLDKNNKHICRWDNAFHFPKLNNFPYHIHNREKKVVSGKAINIFGVLDEIGKTNLI
jgi:hypothetical protein